MGTLVKFTEFQSVTGKWHIGYFGSFKAGMDNFVLPARAMQMRLDKYYEWVIENFDPIIQTHNDKGFISFCWTDYSKAHKLLLELNRAARRTNLTI